MMIDVCLGFIKNDKVGVGATGVRMCQTEGGHARVFECVSAFNNNNDHEDAYWTLPFPQN